MNFLKMYFVYREKKIFGNKSFSIKARKHPLSGKYVQQTLFQLVGKQKRKKNSNVLKHWSRSTQFNGITYTSNSTHKMLNNFITAFYRFCTIERVFTLPVKHMFYAECAVILFDIRSFACLYQATRNTQSREMLFKTFDCWCNHV